jgi:hypothetical protein
VVREVVEEAQPERTKTPDRPVAKSILDTIGERQDQMQKSHGKKIFKDVQFKETVVLPFYKTEAAWRMSEYDDVFRKPVEQDHRRKCDRCFRPLSKRERSRTRKHSCGRSPKKVKN